MQGIKNKYKNELFVMSINTIINPYFLNQAATSNNLNHPGYWSSILNKRWKKGSVQYYDASLSTAVYNQYSSYDGCELLSTVIKLTKPDDSDSQATVSSSAAYGVTNSAPFYAERLGTYSLTFYPFMLFFRNGAMTGSLGGSDRYGSTLYNLCNAIVHNITFNKNGQAGSLVDCYVLRGSIEALLISGTAGNDYPYNTYNSQTGKNSLSELFNDPTSSSYVISNGFQSSVTKYAQNDIGYNGGDTQEGFTYYFRPPGAYSAFGYNGTGSQASVYSGWENSTGSFYSNIMLNLYGNTAGQEYFTSDESTSYHYSKILIDKNTEASKTLISNALDAGSFTSWQNIESRLNGIEGGASSTSHKPGFAMFCSSYHGFTVNINGSSLPSFGSSFYVLVRTVCALYDNSGLSMMTSIYDPLLSTSYNCYWETIEKWGPFVIVSVPDSVYGLERSSSYRSYYLGLVNGTVRYPSLPFINFSNGFEFANTLYVRYEKSNISSGPIIIYSINNALNSSDSNVAVVHPGALSTYGEAYPNTNYLRLPLTVTVFDTRKSNSDSTDVSTNSSLYDTRKASGQGASGHPLEETIQVYNAYDIYASDSSSSHAAFLTRKIGDVSTGVTLSLSTQNRSFTFYVREVIKEEYFTGNDAGNKQTRIYDYALGSLDSNNGIYPYIGVMGKDGFTNFECFDNDDFTPSDNLNVSTKVSLSTDTIGEKSIDVSIHREALTSNQKNIPDSSSIYNSSNIISANISYTPHNIYTVTVTIPDTITTNLDASNNYFYLASSVIESLDAADAGIRNPNNAKEIYLKVGINYTASYLNSVDVSLDGSVAAKDQTDTISPIELWSVPPAFPPGTTYNNLWHNHVEVPMEFMLKDENGNFFATQFTFNNLFANGNKFLVAWNTTYAAGNTSVNRWGDSTYGGSDMPSNPIGYLYPIYTATDSSYNDIFPVNTSFSFIGIGNPNKSVNIPVVIHKTSSTFNAEFAAHVNVFNAGVPIVVSLSKDGEEPWSDTFVSSSLKDSQGGTIPSADMPATDSGSFNSTNGQYTITFANTLASQWQGRIYFDLKDHYDYYTSLYLDITVNPSVTGISVSYNGSVVATDGSIGNLGDIWYHDTASAPHQVTLLSLTGSGVTAGNIIYSCDPSNGNISFGGTYNNNEDVPALIQDTTIRNAAGTQYRLIAQSSIRPNDVSTYVTVTPQKITDTASITSSDSGVNKSSGQTFTFTVDVNGDEIYSSYINGTEYPFKFEDATGTAGNVIPISDVIGANKLVTISGPTLGTLNGTRQLTYVLTVNNAIATDHDIKIWAYVNAYTASTPNYVTSATAVNLIIKKSDATSVTLKRASNDSVISSDLGNYWFAPNDTFDFYGEVAGVTLSDELKNIEYTLTQQSSLNVVAFTGTVNNVPSGKSSGTVTLKFKDSNNANRSRYCTVTAESIQTSGITTSFKFTPLRISDSLGITLSNNTITLGGSTNSTEVALTINGDESIADASLQYKVNSGSYSYTVPNIIDVTSQVQSGNRTKTYTITVNSNVTTTTTITIQGLFLSHGASFPNLSSSEVTLTVKPSASQYSISAAIDSSRNSADKNKLYHDTESSDIIKINVSLGSLVNSYIVYMPSSTPSSYNEVLEQYAGGSWSTIKRNTTGAVNVSDTTIYVRVASLNIGSNPSLTLRFRANDKDTASTSYDEVELTLQLGKVTYSQHTASGDSTSWRGTQGDSSLYTNDTVQFIASYSPDVSTSTSLGSSFVLWYSQSNFVSGSTSNAYSTSNASYKGRSSASDGNTTSVTFGFKYSADIPAAVRGNNTYAVSHTFNVSSLGDASSGNSLSLSPTTRILQTSGASKSVVYSIVKGNQISDISATLSKISGTESPNDVTVSVNSTYVNLTATASGDPGTPCEYSINLSAHNSLGDVITKNDAGTLYWRADSQVAVSVVPSTPNDGSINYPKGDYEITTTYNIIAGSNIASVRFVKIWKDSINPGIPTSSVNGTVNNNSLILTAGNIPSEDATYNICLEVTTNFGDTLTIENAGTVYWAAGNTNFVLTTDPIDSSVSGFGGSASNGAEYVEYTVTCTHKNGEQVISDTWSVVSSETWCKCSAYSGTDGDKIRVYAEGERYSSNRVATLTFTSSHNGAGSSTHTAHLTQRHLTVTPEIAINPTSLTPFGAEASSTSKTVEVTRCVYVKNDSLTTSSIPSREVQATWNRTQSSGSSWLSLNNTSGSQVTNINVIENIDTSSRSAVVTFTTVKPGEFPSGLEITPASVNITVTQNATTYSTCVFEVDGVNDNRTLPVKAAAADVSLGISCYYTKTQSSAGVRVYPGWTISSIKDTNGNNIDWISNKSQQTTDSELWISIGVNATSNPRVGVITLISNQYKVGSKTYVSSVTRTIRVEQGNAAVDFNVATINKTYDVTGVNAVNYNDLKVNTSGTDASWQMSLTDSASFITGVKAKKINGGEVIEPATGLEVKGDASIAVDFVSPNLLNGGQVTSSIPLYSIRRTITASRTASLTVVAVDNTDSTGTVNIIQGGYSWTPSIRTTLTKNGIFDASDNSATLIITSNFDYTVTVPAWMNCTLDSNYPGIFDNNDGETEERERRYNITFNCNFSNNQQTGTIEIRNNKHCTDEGELIGQQSKSLPVSQSTGTRSIKLMHNNQEVNTGSEDLRFSSLGEERQFIVKATCTDWTVASSVDWITINPTLNTTTPSSYESNQQITITVSPNSNTKQGRTASIVFTSVQDNTWKVTYDIVQEQASIYFVIATTLQDLKDHINGDISLDFITSETPYSIGNNISINGESQTYYIMYYYGSSEQTGANVAANNICSTFVTPLLISSSSTPDFVNAGIQPPANSNLYKLIIQISGNETVRPRDIAVALTCAASNNLTVNFLGTQDANDYDAEFDVIGELGNYINGKGWTIPVYGGNYTFTIKNLLDNDTIIVDDIFLDEDINENHDHSSEDYKTWYSVVVPQEAIGSTPRAVTITINPYNIKESTESESAPVEARLNQKFYSVKVTAHSSSRPTSPFTRYLRDNNSNIIQAVQESIEVYSQTSWELLSNDDIIDTETGSKRVYSRNENYGSVSKTVYSEDTGRDLFGTNTPLSIDEEEPISKIAAATAGNGSLALDVRVGVRK